MHPPATAPRASHPREPLLTASQMAVLLHVPLRSIYALCDQGILPVFRVGRLLRFRWDEVLDALAAHRERGW